MPLEAFTTVDGKYILSPGIRNEVYVKPVLDQSAAATACLNVPTKPTKTVRFPIIEKDAAANWVDEGEQITATEPTLSEVEVNTRKVAALTIITNEFKNDTEDITVRELMRGLIRQITAQVDKAFFTSTPIEKAPTGVGQLEGVTELTTDTKNLDVFLEANTIATQAGGYTMQYFAHPTDLEALLKVKDATASNRPLLASKAGDGTATTPDGSTIYTSPHVEQGTLWGIPKEATRMVYESATDSLLGKGPEIVGDSSAYFAWDAIAFRATYRTGFGFLNPAAIAKITLTA